MIEYLENNPSDGHPWIGLIMVAADRQREGLAGEAMLAVCDHVHLNWASPVRMGVIDDNEAGLALAIFLPLHFLALGLAIDGEARFENFLH